MLIYLYGFRKYVDFSTFSQTVDRYNSLVRYLIWFFLLGQLLFLVHLILGLVRRNHGEGKKIR